MEFTPAPPSYPLLEKHDIPIVVGVGVSLAFIFITMAFYSLVQKNDSSAPSRGGWKACFPAYLFNSLFCKHQAEAGRHVRHSVLYV